MMKIGEIIKLARDEYLWDGTGENSNLFLIRKFADPVLAMHFCCEDSFSSFFVGCKYSDFLKESYQNIVPLEEELTIFDDKKITVTDIQNIRYMLMTLLMLMAEDQGI